jgi:hypothetical protein
VAKPPSSVAGMGRRPHSERSSLMPPENNCELYYVYSLNHLGHLQKLCIVKRINESKDFSCYNTSASLNFPCLSLPCIDRKLLLTKKPHWEKLVQNKLYDWDIHKSKHELILECLELFLPILILLSFLIVFGKK